MTTLQQFGAVLEKRVTVAYSKKIENILQNLQNDIEKVHGQFFSILGQKIIGRTTFEGVGAYKTHWQKLSEEYTDRRLKMPSSPADNQFFIYSGDLKSALKELKTEIIFGSPIIKYKKGSTAAGDSGEIIYGRNKKGKIFKSTVNTKGKFISASNLEKGLKLRVSINVFSKIKTSGQGKFSSSINLKDYFNAGNQDIGYKLGNSAKAPNSRPVINPYLNWWVNVKIRNIVNKRLR